TGKGDGGMRALPRTGAGHRPIESVVIDEGFGCLDRQGRQVWCPIKRSSAVWFKEQINAYHVVAAGRGLVDGQPSRPRFVTTGKGPLPTRKRPPDAAREVVPAQN